MSAGQGRRAVAQEATIHSSTQSAEEENTEKDAALRQVQARDLIDFGMIPVNIWKLSEEVGLLNKGGSCCRNSSVDFQF